MDVNESSRIGKTGLRGTQQYFAGPFDAVQGELRVM
jgi:hypothetical protein